MGLDVSHDAFSGAYSAFNRFRQSVAQAMSGSFPPHIRSLQLDDDSWYWDKKVYSKGTHPGLFELMSHSDCDGSISPQMCIAVANELEALLPKLEEMATNGHLSKYDNMAGVARQFIKGCREAAEANENLEFM